MSHNQPARQPIPNREEVLTSDEFPPAMAELLQALTEDIQTFLNEPEKPAADKAVEAKSLRDRVECLESEHPVVTGLLSRFTESLAGLGI